MEFYSECKSISFFLYDKFIYEDFQALVENLRYREDANFTPLQI